MAANLFQPSLGRALDSNGNPINGAKLYFYLTGTTTAAAWYVNQAGTTAGTNPLVSNSAGLFAPAFLDPDVTYRVRLTDTAGNVIWDVDPVRGFDETQLVVSAANAVEAAASAQASLAAAQAAQAAAEQAEAGANAAVVASQDYFPGARSYVPQGAVTGAATISTAGTGGTNGTFDLAFSGGNFAVNPTGTFTVTGGAVTAITITGPGLYIGGSISKPTLSFAASAGLTGAAGTFNTVYLKTAGQYWLTDTSPASAYLALFQNQANAAVEIDAQFDPMSAGAAAAIADALADDVANSLAELEGVLSATVGEAADVGSSLGANFSFMNTAGSPVTGFVRTIDVRSNATQEAIIFTAVDNGGGTVTLVNSVRVYLQNALNLNVPVNLPINKGELVGIYGPNSIYYTNTGQPAYYASGLIGTGTAVSTGATFGIQFKANIVGADKETIAQVDSYGKTFRIGRETVVDAVSAAGPSFALFNYECAQTDGYVTEVEVAVNGNSPAAKILIVDMTAGGTLNLARSIDVALFAGINRVKLNGVPITRGQFVGILANGVKQSTGGDPAFYTSGAPTTGTAKVILSNYGLQFGVTIETAERAEPAPVSVSKAASTDGTDATAEFAKARTNVQGLYVPPGDYAVTSLRFNGDGLYGDGRIFLNGQRFFIPRAPSTTSLLMHARSAFLRQIGDVSGLALLGDSLTQATIAPTNWAKSWPYMLARFLNAPTSPNDLPAVCQFSTAGNALGITLPASPTIVSSGPQGQALQLQAGQTLTLAAGDFNFVDVFYDRAPGAGTLSFAFNGGAAYRTVACSGTAATDLTTYNGTATGNAGTSGVYTITASGGPVTITGLVRLGALTNTFLGRLPIYNYGVNSQVIPALSSTRITSIINQMSVFGGSNHGAILMYGENDQIGTTPSTIYTNVTAKIDELRAAGFKSLWGCSILRPNATLYTYSPGCSYRGANGAVIAAYQDKGVPVIRLDTIDFNGMGFSPDGVHPNDPGQDYMLQLMLEEIRRGWVA